MVSDDSLRDVGGRSASAYLRHLSDLQGALHEGVEPRDLAVLGERAREVKRLDDVAERLRVHA